MSTRQWYIRNGGRDEDLKRAMLQRGEELGWIPPHMKYRYDNWVSGLNGDWLISRQRFFGVPFPVWYTLDAAGDPDYDHPILADENHLPVDPSSEVPPGFSESERGTPGGFIADPDVMDTWATSSLTPQIACGWDRDPELVRGHISDGPQHPRARDHSHLAVLPGGPCALREPLAAVAAFHDQRLCDGSRSQEDEQVQGQHSGADGRAGTVRLGRRTLAGRQDTARAGFAV